MISAKMLDAATRMATLMTRMMMDTYWALALFPVM